MNLFCICILCGSNNDLATKDEEITVDYGKIADLAKAEFENVFKEFEDIKVVESKTIAKSDDAKEIVFVMISLKKQ